MKRLLFAVMCVLGLSSTAFATDLTIGQLEAEINAKINTNGHQAITGSALNGVLIDMTNSLLALSGLGAGVAGVLTFAPNAIGGFLTTPSGVCTSGQFLTFLTASSAPTCGTPAAAGGTVTSVATGFGLTGGPITSTGTAAYDPTQIGWSYRNRLINSGMLIDQVNVGSAYTLAATSGITNYTLDQWYAYESAAGTGLTATQLSVKTGGVNYALRVQRTAASTNTNITALAQPIESNNMIDLQGQAVTLSFRARVGANWSGTTPTVAIITGTTADQGAASLAAGTWAGQTTCGSATPTLTTSFAFYVVTCTVASGALEIAPKISWTWSGTAGANDYLDITDVELVPGTYAAAQIVPERHRIRYDLAECSRYYQTTYGLGVAVGTATTAGMVEIGDVVGSSTTITRNAQFAVPMRAAPSIAFWDGAGTLNKMSQSQNGGAIANGITVSGAIATIVSSTNFLNQVYSGSTTASFLIHYAANARL